MNIRFTVSISYSHGPTYAPGDVADVDDAEANRLITAGYATAVVSDGPEQATGGRGRRKAIPNEQR